MLPCPEVDIDPETGVTRIVRYFAAIFSAPSSIHDRLRQLHGGVAQASSMP